MDSFFLFLVFIQSSVDEVNCCFFVWFFFVLYCFSEGRGGKAFYYVSGLLLVSCGCMSMCVSLCGDCSRAIGVFSEIRLNLSFVHGSLSDCHEGSKFNL